MASFENLLKMYLSGEHSFLDVVEYWADKNPSNRAVSAIDGELSYAALMLRVNTIAQRLADMGISKGDLVAVSVDRTVNLLPLLLGVWSVGAAYVPVDPSYPYNRRKYIIKDSCVKLIVCDDISENFDGVTSFKLLDLVQSEDASGPSCRVNDTQALAYLIYTSGSTGEPKGVMVSCGNVANFLTSMRIQPGMTATDRLLATTTISFDIHVLELFLPLLTGGQVIIASSTEVRSLVEIQRLIDDCYITVMQATPATWRLVLSGGWSPALPLKILVGGEAFPNDLLPRMLACGDDVWNMYGPTETTVWSTCYKVSSSDAVPCIGLPIQNTATFIVDSHNNLVQRGESGELLIGGEGVTLGYKGKPALTQERFISLPDLSGGVLYRTGDLVRADQQGYLHYINRLDNQIKIRGFRIEPGDIEGALGQYEGLECAVVVVCTLSVGDERLVAFYTGAAFDSQELRKHCAQLLPAHMVPQHFICLGEFPKTDNQKINRKALQLQGVDYLHEGVYAESEVNGAARDDRDRSVIAVWENALGVGGIGIDDDFFDLGGHSLLAFPVVEAMSKATGLSYTPSDLFERPTVRSILNEVNGPQGAASVVKLNKGCDGAIPIFCLCGVNIYLELATKFESNPVYGMFAQQEIALIGAANSDSTIQVSIPALVEAYVDAILRQGEYAEVILVGLSFGGILSVEVAKALEANGVEVKAVVMLDAYLPGCAERTLQKTLIDVCRRIKSKGVAAALKGIYKRCCRWVGQQSIAPHVIDLEVDERARERMFDQISYGYRSQASLYENDVLLVKAKYTDFGLGFQASHDYEWGKVVGGELAICSVDADHVGMMKGEAIDSVYCYIKEYLDQRR